MNEAEKEWNERKELYNRYTRKKDLSDVKIALEYYISNIACGYFAGKDPVYKVKKEENEIKRNIIQKFFDKIFGENNDADSFQVILDYIKDYNDNSSFFYDVAKDYLIMRAGYGLLYENSDNEIVYAHTSALNTIGIWDYSTPRQLIGVLRSWEETDANGNAVNKVELITEDFKRYYVNEKLQSENFKELEDERQDVKWLLIPALVVENPDNIGIFENVITLIDKYEQVIRNNANTFQYNDDAKLKVIGYKPQNEVMIEERDENGNIVVDEFGNVKMIQNPARIEEDNLILNAKVFYTPDKSDGDIDWIIKNVNDTASENHKKTCLDMALMISGVPNVTDQGFTNADNSSALEKKFFPLEQVLIQADKLFKKELLRMWENIVDRINTKKNTKYDFRDIEIILTRNLPQNNQEIIDGWLKLRGLLSDKTVIDHLPYELDSESEIALRDEETDENFNKNLERTQKFGDNTNAEKEEEVDDERADTTNEME